MAEQKILTLTGLQTYNTEAQKKIDAKDAEILKQAKEYSDSLGVNYDPAGTAATKVKELADGAVKTNTDAIAAIQTGKADKADTLAGYGITNAYTKDETKNEITTAIANADHLKREIVDVLPSVEEADENTIYMVPKPGKSTNGYNEYMLLTNKEGEKAFEQIGDSTVDLTNYATKTEVATAKSEAVAEAKEYADGLAANYATAEQGAKADTALQKADVTSGTGNGTISVKGEDVAVTGLKSAAYTDAADYEQAGAVDSLRNGQVKTNTDEINTLKGRVDAIGTFTEITEDEILAMFS